MCDGWEDSPEEVKEELKTKSPCVRNNVFLKGEFKGIEKEKNGRERLHASSKGITMSTRRSLSTHNFKRSFGSSSFAKKV
jgi:hypothetical protein